VSARQDLATRARSRLGTALDDLLGDRLRLTEKRPRDGAGWVDVSGHDLSEPCPARWSVPVDDFAETTRTVAGAVGRLALRERTEDEAPGAVVDRVLADLVEVDPDAFYLDWYLGLDRSAQAAVRAASTTWAVGALRAVGGRRLVWSPRRQPADVEGRTIRLRGTWDASDRRAKPDVLVVMSGRAPADDALPALAGFNALVDGLLRREVVERVRIGSAATATTVAVPVTEDLLGLAIDRVVELVRHRVEPDAAPAVPGAWCRHCPQLDVCPEGTAHRAL
jgi:hypothetical protein